MVVLEWTLSNSLGRYQQLLLPNISVSVVPNPETEIGNMCIHLILPYNTLYNVSLTQLGICGQFNQTAFITLHYSKQALSFKKLTQCSHPSKYSQVL